MGITQTTTTTGSHQQALLVFQHIANHIATGYINDSSTNRHFDDDIVPTMAGTVGTTAIFATLGTEAAGIAVINQRIGVIIGNDNHITALATVPAIRTTKRNKFFPAKAGHTIAAVTSLHRNNGFIDKAHDPFSTNKKLK
jgi:hypothetical protein